MIRLALVVAVALGLFYRTLGFGFVYVDDDRLLIDRQSQLAAPMAPWRAFGQPYFQSGAQDHAYYRPLVGASYALDAQWRSQSASDYHRTNCLLHALAAGLLFLWLRQRGCRENLAFCGGLAFAVHPTVAEAIAWIPGRPDVMMTVFALTAGILLGRSHHNEKWVGRACHLLAFLGALLSKEAAIVLPAIWWLEGHWQQRQTSSNRSKERWIVGGWSIVALVYAVARTWALSSRNNFSGLDAAPSAFSGLWSTSPSLVSSLGKLVLPVQLSVLATPDDTWLWPGILATTAIGGLWFFWKSGRQRVQLAVAGYVLVMLPSLPATRQLVLECRLYLPAVYLIWLACVVAEQIPWRARVTAGFSVVVGLLTWRTYGYLDAFRDRRTFAEAAVQGSPHLALAHKNLGVAYHLAGDTDAAWREYQAVLTLDDAEPVAHNNLGVILMAKAHLADAERELRRELEVNPHYAQAHHNLALVLRATGRNDEAAPHWQASIEANSQDFRAISELADYYHSRDVAKAEQYRRLLVSERSQTKP